MPLGSLPGPEPRRLAPVISSAEGDVDMLNIKTSTSGAKIALIARMEPALYYQI